MARPDPLLIVTIRDPNDIVVIQTAIIGGAETICTTDEDFFTPPASTFLQSVNIQVFTDAELMAVTLVSSRSSPIWAERKAPGRL
jgi:predicted nucleic acid-binding protein